MRFFLQLAYNGAAYHGWQNQDNAITVQKVVDEVLSRRFDRPITVTGAGRTDTGVHASNYFAHFDIDQLPNQERIRDEISSMLPTDIALRGIWPVSDEAHARFSAISREYIYVISRSRDPFLNPYTHFYHSDLDLGKMMQAVSILPGERDFSAFEKLGSDNAHSVCNLMHASFTESGDLLLFHVKANRFLRNMVRAIVGSLLDVGRGKLEPQEFGALIESHDRRLAGSSAPAKGLFLCGIGYPPELFTEGLPEFRVLPPFLTGIV